MGFGERIREHRIGLNYSQKELAEITGLTLRTIQRIESNEVKPSFYSMKEIGKALHIDLTEFAGAPENKAYEFSLTIKITDMRQFFKDLETLIKNNWKIVFLLAVIAYFLTNYTDIKSGIMDGWNGE